MIGRTAGLPMYDLPELRWATDRLWQEIAGRLAEAGMEGVPATLDRDRPPEAQWSDPALLFGQTCGYPYTHAHSGQLRLVATPCYAAPGCDGPLYRSLLVVRDDCPAETLAGLRGTVCAVNGWDSQSGWNCLAALAAPLGQYGRFFAGARVTGSHAASLAAVAAGAADIAAIDCVTHALLARHRPAALAGLRSLGFGPAAPGLPYVTAHTTSPGDVALLRAALAATMDDPDLAPVREALLLAGAVPLDDDAYAAIPSMAATGLPKPPEL